MSEEKKHTIVIPAKCGYTKPLCCPVDPPHEFMSVEMTLAGEDAPFRTGLIVGRRCPTIDAFLFRPGALNKTSRQRDKPLKKGDIIQIKVTLFKKGDVGKRTLSEPFQSETADVEVT